MRAVVAGLLLLLVCSQSALAQAIGEVESVGFNNTYRPDAWTPMVVRLRPQQQQPASYTIAVYQYDLDGDRPIYTRPITLNGSDSAAEQRFWMYFLPQPINKGLPDPGNDTTALKDLQHELQVFLCTPAGKPIVQLPITSTLNNIDPYRDYAQDPRGAKLIVAVTDGASQPIWRDYQFATGITEDVEFVTLSPKDLPEDPIGYEGIDSIVWFDSDPTALEEGGQHKLQTLSDYVRFGGQLVICQPAIDWQKTLNFGDLMPVTVSGIASKNDLEPLRAMANPREPDPEKPAVDPWSRQTGPFAFARATAKPAALVDSWIDWKGDGTYADTSPFLARMAVGLGQVTWVAADLGSPAIAGRTTTGWPYVWDRVFGWNNNTYVPPASASKDDETIKARTDLYSPGNPVDLGAPLRDGLNFESRGAWLIILAIAFFLVYWVVAGPGGYFYLALHKRASFNWFFFGLAALGATLVTVAVVKLVLRGPPEIRHISLVRVAPDEPTYIYSRFGLYIPRDGDQSLVLNNTTHQGVSYLSAWAEHPQSLGDATEFPAPADYDVPVRDLDSTDPPALTVPYRSSMKKFQSVWIGDASERFTGKVKLDASNGSIGLSGPLTNASGQDFSDVYLAYHNADEDRLIYIPKWPRSTTFHLPYDLGRAVAVGEGHTNLEARPGEGKVISDILGNGTVKGGNSRDLHWTGYWYNHYFSHTGGLGEEEPTLSDAFPMLSLFDRLPPAWNKPPDPAHPTSGTSNDRFELFRRGARGLNASGSLMAGRLLILASANRPLPVPMQVDGNDIGGTGTVLYQFELPIDRPNADRPTTQP